MTIKLVSFLQLVSVRKALPQRNTNQIFTYIFYTTCFHTNCFRMLLFCSGLLKAVVHTAVGKKTEVFFPTAVWTTAFKSPEQKSNIGKQSIRDVPWKILLPKLGDAPTKIKMTPSITSFVKETCFGNFQSRNITLNWETK